MKRAIALVLVAGVLAPVFAQDLTPYTLEEIDQFLKVFKQTYKNQKAPQDDAVAVLEDLQKAYEYLQAKVDKDEASPEEVKAQKAIVKAVILGLKARKRPLVTLDCAKALGLMGAKDGGKALMKWMDKTVLDAKSPNPQWVEYGFRSLAWIGGDDRNTLDLVRKYATGKHLDIGVAAQAMRASYEWRSLSGKSRKELFGKILSYVGGLHSGMRGGDPKRRGDFEKRYNTVKDEGLKALWQLAGTEKAFADPPAARAWYKDNKKRKWTEYTGVSFRTKAKPKKSGA